MENCAARICKALNIRNMKQVDLSEKTGIPKSAISQYCSGSFKPKQGRLFLIAKALDVDEAWLMGLDVPMERGAAHSGSENYPQGQIDTSRDSRNIIKIAARDGTFIERELNDQQVAALKAILDQMPDVPDDL